MSAFEQAQGVVLKGFYDNVFPSVVDPGCKSQEPGATVPILEMHGNCQGPFNQTKALASTKCSKRRRRLQIPPIPLYIHSRRWLISRIERPGKCRLC